jgi:hypothetical protein
LAKLTPVAKVRTYLSIYQLLFESFVKALVIELPEVTVISTVDATEDAVTSNKEIFFVHTVVFAETLYTSSVIEVHDVASLVPDR